MFKSCNCLMSNNFREKNYYRKVFRTVTIITVLLTLLTSLVFTNVISVYAEETEVPITEEETAENVGKVKTLAQKLYNENNFATQNGGYNYIIGNNYPNGSLFTWDSESRTSSSPKYRSWTYYNGIMMDAFLMLDETSFRSKVINFYDANIIDGSVDNTKPSDSNHNKNKYAVNELDSIPPARTLFDLIKSSAISETQKANYKNLIYYVYGIVKAFPKADGTNNTIFKHKYGSNNSSWENYQVGLDGLYMAQPFLMEIANCLDSEDNPLDSSMISSSSNDLYTAVYNSMVWVKNTMYNSENGLYHHGWGKTPGTNGHYWLRGIGWYAAALADVISMMPDETYRNCLIKIEKELFDGMMAYQDSNTGMWRNVVNYDQSVPDASQENKFESSGTALMAYAMMKLYSEGYIDDSKYGEAGLKAFNGTVINKMSSGNLEDVYRSSGVETTDAGYLRSTYETNEAKGVAPLMMAASYANAAADKLNVPSVSYTVTFKVVNGSWNDKTNKDITVALTGKEGDELKLAGEQIPEAGNEPEDGYKSGSWDSVPSTETVISADTTYTYTYAEKEKEVPQVTAPVAKTLTYNGSDQTLAETGSSTGGTMQYALGESKDAAPADGWSGSVPTGKDAGTYYLWYQVAGNNDYKDVEPACVVVTIGKADPVILESPAASSITYGGSLSDSHLTAGKADTAGSFSWTNPETKPDVSDSNQTEYDIDFTPEDTKNYNKVTGKVKVTVNKADIHPVVTLEGWVYGSSAKEPSITGNSGNASVTYEYKKKDAADSTYSSTVPEDAGDYVLKASVAENDNYNAGTATTEFTISKKEASITTAPAAKENLVYNGTEQVLVTAGTTDASTMSYSTDGQNYSTELPKGRTAGTYTIYYKITGDANHTGTNPETITVSIQSKPVKITEIKADDKVYDGTTQATITGNLNLEDAAGSDSDSLNGSRNLLSSSIKASGQGLIGGDQVDVEVTAAFEDKNVGEDKKVTFTDVSLSGTDAGNYQLTEYPTEGKAAITPKEVGLNWSDTSFNYDGNAHVPRATVTGLIAGDECSVTVEGEQTNSGRYTATATGLSNNNYKLPGNVTQSFTITDTGSTEPDQPDTPSIEGSVRISGLEAGDTVKLYKVIGWKDSSGWELESTFAGISSASQLDLNHQQVNIDTKFVNEINGKINSETQTADVGSPVNGTYTSGKLDPGMYIAIITSAKPGVIYNPVIVSRNFFKPNGPIDASQSSIPIFGNEGSVAKKGDVHLEKTGKSGRSHDTNWQETVAKGDQITFTVTTVIPPFMTYLHPYFSLTDQLSEGLTYTEGSAEVTVPADLNKGSQYTVPEESKSGYTLSFSGDYLKSIGTAVPVTITYKATVTNEAAKSVNHDVNTVTLEYANNPNTSTDRAKLKDRTNHYTFSIDADLLGHNGYGASELVKVGIDVNGEEITKSTTLSNSGKIGALAEAHFALYQADDEWKKMGDAIIDDVKSGQDGRITMKGLDAGKYLLIETQAPAGYIKASDPVRIEIIANVQPSEYEEDGYTIQTDELKSYRVLVNGEETAKYTITNKADPSKTTSDEGDTVVGKDGDKGKIKNVQGAELPSTGGPGTTTLYLLGIILTGLSFIGLVMRFRWKTTGRR